MKATREIKRDLEREFPFLSQMKQSWMRGRGYDGHVDGESREKYGVVEIDLYDGDHDIRIKKVDENLLAREPRGETNEVVWAILDGDRIVQLRGSDGAADSIGRQIAHLEGVLECVVVSVWSFHPRHRAMTIYKMEKFDLRAWAERDHQWVMAQFERDGAAQPA
ncbi:MAG: hypothetical protein NT039_01755 [Candidatus Berkelbacteria bacterium]|nr:hypothetical protein [Candidatus Berkelbacteria bacterium]